ncbi:MAG: hypothetical protein J6328_04675 [Bacilli bacterium]|nr:hypothetical protein [Bacilli bacterium]
MAIAQAVRTPPNDAVKSAATIADALFSTMQKIFVFHKGDYSRVFGDYLAAAEGFL